MNKNFIIGAAAILLSASTLSAEIKPTNDLTLQQMQNELGALQVKVSQLQQQRQTKRKQLSTLRRLLSGNSVVIAPYTNKPTFYSGGQLIVSAPSINEDAKLLYRRLLNQRDLKKTGLPVATSPRLVLSGKAEGKVNYTHPYAGRYSSDINLSAAELDALAEIGPWVNAFMAFTYEDGPANKVAGVTGNNRRISNSRIYLDKGFITTGNFNQSGLYSSIGQLYVPFGRYSSNMISSPLTTAIGKTKARAITLNYIADPRAHAITPYTHLFVFKGDTKYGKHTSIIKNGGADAGLWIGDDQTNGSVGASYLYNIADSNDMQDNGNSSGFMGFERTSGSPSSENIVHRVGGIDFYGKFATGPYSFIAEVISAMQRFTAADMTYDGHGAKPKALNVEGAYAFKIFSLPSSFAVGYGMSRQALALAIPAQRYVAAWSITPIHNVTFTLEGRRDKNYGRHTSATGSGVSATTLNQLGRSNYVVNGELAVYF